MGYGIWDSFFYPIRKDRPYQIGGNCLIVFPTYRISKIEAKHIPINLLNSVNRRDSYSKSSQGHQQIGFPFRVIRPMADKRQGFKQEALGHGESVCDTVLSMFPISIFSRNKVKEKVFLGYCNAQCCIVLHSALFHTIYALGAKISVSNRQIRGKNRIY